MSGSRSTDRRESATTPNSTAPAVTMNTVTGRRIDPSTSFIAAARLEPDGLDAGPGLQAPLTDRHHPLTGGEPREDLGIAAFHGSESDRPPHHRVAAGDEHVVFPVLGEHPAARH